MEKKNGIRHPVDYMRILAPQSSRHPMEAISSQVIHALTVLVVQMSG